MWVALGIAAEAALLVSVLLTVWTICGGGPGLLVLASAFSVGFCVVAAASIGLLVLPLPLVQCGLGIWGLLPDRRPVLLRLLWSALGAAVWVFVIMRLMAHLIGA